MYTVASITPDAGKRILTNYNNSKMMIEGNGVTISEDYKTHWYATNYTPAGIRLYTNYQNNTFNWNGGTFTDDYKTHWYATNYTPAGIRLYTNYQNNTFNWNGGTFTDDYKTHWFNTGRSYPVKSYHKGGYRNDWKESGTDTIRLYTNYDNTRTRAPAISVARWSGPEIVLNTPYTNNNIAYVSQIWINDTLHSANPAFNGWSSSTGGNPYDPTNLGGPPNYVMPDYDPNTDGVYLRYCRQNLSSYTNKWNYSQQYFGGHLRYNIASIKLL